MINPSPVNVIEAVSRYMYNTPYYKIFTDVYGEGHHDSYRDEKVAVIPNFVRWWGMLDNEHRQRLVDLALAKYSNEL